MSHPPAGRMIRRRRCGTHFFLSPRCLANRPTPFPPFFSEPKITEPGLFNAPPPTSELDWVKIASGMAWRSFFRNSDTSSASLLFPSSSFRQ